MDSTVVGHSMFVDRRRMNGWAIENSVICKGQMTIIDTKAKTDHDEFAEARQSKKIEFV